jgi:hypothetical protein
MATTFMKRQKEMKRLEKQRAKAERRAQKKLAKGTPTEPPADDLGTVDREAMGTDLVGPPDSEPHV